MRIRSLVLVSLALAGCATEPGLPLMDEATETIGPGARLSKQFLLEEGQALEWDWTSETPVTFVARHEVQGIVVPSASRLSHSGRIEGADGAGAFWLEWTAAEGTEGSIQYVLRGTTARPETLVGDP